MSRLTLIADTMGERADVFLARTVDGLTRSVAQRLLDEGQVTFRNRSLKKNFRLEPGMELTVNLPEPEPSQALPQNIPLEIVYEDGDVIVVNKPVGLVVHPAPGHPDGTLVNALLYHCGSSLSGVGGVLRPGIVHRIDRDTSGLVIAAKNDAAHLSLAEQLKDHSLSRTYEGIIIGGLPEDSGTVDAPIARHPTDRKKMAVRPDGKPAVTHWEVLARYPGYTHARFHLETGRTHQIRVHMAHLGHPILGDPVYGGVRAGFLLAGQCLHARRLAFTHPRTGERMEITCQLPAYFTAVLEQLRQI